jgi:hypothetical protein
VKILEAEGPKNMLESDHRQSQKEFNSQIEEVQRAVQDLSMSMDKLENMNKSIERSASILFGASVSKS